MFTTPVTPPGAPPHAPRLISMESDGEFVSVSLSFEPPSHWGGDKEDALSYQLEILAAGEHTGSPQLILCQESCIEDLTLALDTAYRVRVRALNSVGPGPLSSALRLTTPPHPPPPPQLFLAAAMPRALRLGWELTEDQEAVCVEARRGEAHDFHVVYEGSELCCKVSRLREDCEYEFRARAIGKGGEGLPGPVQAFRTLPAPKPIPRGLRVSEVCSGSCVAVWQPHKPQHSHSSSSEGELHCVVQVSNNRQQDYRKVYRGSDAKCVVTELVPHTEYWLRAAFVPAGDIPDPKDGPFCAPISFITTAPEPAPVVPAAIDVADSGKELASSSLQFPLSLPKVSAWQLLRRWRRVSIKDLTDHQKVFLFVLAFFVGSVVLAVAISRFM
ncbi:hypothetical protein B566_EDAN004415 [Ephemera danica]|nr:hypothetical protein B566_EDAN004415 [Ephemera danica]